MRKLMFEQVVDSRFNEDKDTLLDRHAKLLNIFSHKNGLIFTYGPIRKITFEGEEGCTQYRIKYLLRKTARCKLNWNDIYKLVNGIKAVPYHFV